MFTSEEILNAIDIFGNFPPNFPFLETVIGAVLAVVVGIFWYHPKVMGEQWAEAHGTPIEHYKPHPLLYLLMALFWFVSAFIYAFLMYFLDMDGIDGLLALSTFLWVGFVLPNVLINGLFAGKKMAVMAVDSSYFLAGLYLFAVIHDVL